MRRYAVGDIFDLGAEDISVTCAKRGVNMSKILHDLKPLVDSKLISVAQPDGQPGYSCTETSILSWSNSFATHYVSNCTDPEGGLPATGFFFDLRNVFTSDLFHDIEESDWLEYQMTCLTRWKDFW